MTASASPGIIADGFERFTGSEGFVARERAVRAAVLASFAPRYAAARTPWEQLGLLWDHHRELRRALRDLYPSPHACFALPLSSTAAEPNPALGRTHAAGDAGSASDAPRPR